MTRRVLYALLAGVILATLTPSTALAQKPTTSCPAEASGWFLVDRDLLWELTVVGFELEGIEVYDEFGSFTPEFDAFVAALGFEDGAAFEEFVRGDQWDRLDVNRNDVACLKLGPANTAGFPAPGFPAYIFQGIDDRASTPHGQSVQ